MLLFSSLKNIIFILSFVYRTLDNQDLDKKLWKRLSDNLKGYSSSREASNLSKFPSCCTIRLFEELVDEQLNDVPITTLTKYELFSLLIKCIERFSLLREK